MRKIKFRMWNGISKKYHYDVENVLTCLAQQNVFEKNMPTRGFTTGYDHVGEGSVFEQLLHIEKNGREWYKGDLAKMDIYVPPTNHHDGNGWLNNDDGFEGYAIGEVAFHIRHGLCLKNYKLFDLNTDEEVAKTTKFKTICLSRTTIVGNIHTQDGGQEG